jgi:hypothetical protein
MVVTGAVAVWRWDALFPDRRDYMNLVPLPLSTKVIFLANFTAVLGLASVLAVDVNAASAVLFPLAASSGQETLRYAGQLAGMHGLTVTLASVFSFFAVLAAAGVSMVALPNLVFRRISIYLRGLIIVLLVGLLSTGFAIPSMINQMPKTPIRFLPSLWFLGLAELIHGAGNPALSTLGWLALKAFGFVILISLAPYGLSYRRYFARIPDGGRQPKARRGPVGFAGLFAVRSVATENPVSEGRLSLRAEYIAAQRASQSGPRRIHGARTGSGLRGIVFRVRRGRS